MKSTNQRIAKSMLKLKLTEKEIQKSILEYLKLKGIYAWRNNSGVLFSTYKGKSRMIQFGKKGSSDIIGILREGRMLAIEVKNEKGKLSPEQEEFMHEINQRDGWAFVARSLDDVIAKLDKY